MAPFDIAAPISIPAARESVDAVVCKRRTGRHRAGMGRRFVYFAGPRSTRRDGSNVGGSADPRRDPYAWTPKSRSAAFSVVFLSVLARRCPMMRAQGTE